MMLPKEINISEYFTIFERMADPVTYGTRCGMGRKFKWFGLDGIQCTLIALDGSHIGRAFDRR